MEITIAGATRNVVHRNLTLVRADSPAEAYDKSIGFGYAGETSYDNPAGKLVEHRFRGISKLEDVPFGLDDGSELMFEEQVGVRPEEIGGWIPPKEQLAVFLPTRTRPDDDTNYASAEILRMIREDR